MVNNWIAGMDKKTEKKLYAMLGAHLRQERNSAGLAQDDVAVNVGFDRRHYGRIESGQKKVSITRLIEICCVLGIEPGLLVDRLAKEYSHDS